MNRPRPSVFAWTLRVLGFLVLAALTFSLPQVPSTGLDASWQTALGKFFLEHRQFGTEIVFTYGPLGWTMGNMYWGGQWGSLLAWQAAQATVVASLLLWHGRRLSLAGGIVWFAFFVLVGMRYQDVMQQAVLLLVGLELIRRAETPWRWSSALFLVLLAMYSLVKFTNAVLALVFIALAIAVAGQRKLWRPAMLMPGVFLGLLLIGWLACGQSPLHLPAYLLNSWEISSGYQDAMGASCPAIQLYVGLTVAALSVGFLLLHAWQNGWKFSALIPALAAAAYLFVNWKHGFTRADGHQLLFYQAALALVAFAPAFSAPGLSWRLARVGLLATITVAAVWGALLVVPSFLRDIPSGTAARLQAVLRFIRDPETTRAGFVDVLSATRRDLDMPLTRQITRGHTLDVLGFEQINALINELPYSPRPVFQGYSAYTPRLARLNEAHYLSPRAPDYVLLKLQPIDSRLATMEDPLVLRHLAPRYSYLFSEHGFTLWQRRADSTHEGDATPTPVRTVTTTVGAAIDVADLAAKNVWVTIDYRLNLLGRLRRFFFKPPTVRLRVTDEDGVTSRFLLPRPIAATGFLLNPVIEDLADYMRALGGTARRRAVSIAIEPAPNDRDCVADDVTVSLATLPPFPGSGLAGLPLGRSELPLTFARGSVPYGSDLSLSEGRLEYFAHAPSSLVYRPAPAARTLRGSFGLRPSAYDASNQHPTDGAEFVVKWKPRDGSERVLFRRLLKPVEQAADRGLQSFQVPLPAGAEGELEFVTGPGPQDNSACDWTYWSDLMLENSP